MRGVAWRAMAVVLCCAAWDVCAARAQQDAAVPTLHAYANLVQVPTLVLSREREPIPPVAEGRFYVSLDGGPKFRVTHARLEGEDPITLAILLDLSQPYPQLMDGMEDAVAGLAPQWLHAHDRVSVYSMDCELTRTSMDMPANPVTLKRDVARALETWRQRGEGRGRERCSTGWHLWDSLTLLTQRLGAEDGRRVVLVVTDGVDRGSKTKWEDLRYLAQQHAVAVFGLTQDSYMLPNLRMADPVALREFNGVCELSGGMVLAAERKNLAKELEQFTKLLRGRYIVEFPHPLSTVGGDHDLEITIAKMDAFIRPAGISVPVDDPKVLSDPTRVPSDPGNAPVLGKKKAGPG